MTIQLITDFKQASKQCDRETKLLAGQIKTSLLGTTALNPIALWEPKQWKDCSGYNCYNFALNTKEARRMAIPGAFSPEDDGNYRIRDDLHKWHESIHQAVQRDGLIFLGDSFSHAAAQALNPVALFIRPAPLSGLPLGGAAA